MELQPNTLYLDIRPSRERWDPSIGFIPASIHAPMVSSKKLDLTPSIDLFQHFEYVSFVCLSGHRSALMHEHNPRIMGLPTSSLEGGVLAWKASGQPVAGTFAHAQKSLPIDQKPSLQNFQRLLTSCFLAETTETILDNDLDFEQHNPQHIIQQAYLAEDVRDIPTRRQLRRVFDRLALQSALLGTQPKRICANVDSMLQLLRTIPA